ncbi:restriction endonuclease PLD domain-containing protein [Alkalihalobacillus sp. LMS39]|uniref:restriction endonuclease PLD domain-containing protein n=1 Tax=Alkalihalobacillus sp. LMS39 TaxID=2924032 RepID=UPI001FB1FA5A|nr:restriction endonuclease PLD domain-containing protein [Alkalihalobacillus sp. LMS39]UOE95104.1 NgoFVII family restriction endonuclease [Alkalihalobacillus sp. LMS39]
MFFSIQTKGQREQYIKQLQAVGSLSNLFSESKTPYLYYRAAENIFCKALEANNLSRGDISFDAFKGNVGIGLKTFVHGNGKKYEKIAEFNKDIDKFKDLNAMETVQEIAKLRNQRIRATQRAHDTNRMIYHMVTRKEAKFEIHEEEMHYIDFDTLKLDKKKTTDKNLFFSDKNGNYKFYIAKSTLYKQFITDTPLETFKVDILDDPFDFLLTADSKQNYMVQVQEEKFEQVYLPLYSVKSGNVEDKSGLNQWNAGGRKRDIDEVYIPIPAWIHRQFEGFFPYDRNTDKKESFILVLPGGKEIDAKICQGGGKGFMSKPNKALGHWILRTILEVPEGQLVKYEDLDRAGIDSVLITKLGDYKFKINFASKGSYADFEDEYKI